MKKHNCKELADDVSIYVDRVGFWVLDSPICTKLTIFYCPYCGKKLKRYDNESPNYEEHYVGELGLNRI
ncbi:MAG: hypothetical protein KAS32_09995 [Candidatus Peribacteraceae bacterium]|nr:hypothetical protein [Candidatus Peribacteraceae bacterium]